MKIFLFIFFCVVSVACGHDRGPRESGESAISRVNRLERKNAALQAENERLHEQIDAFCKRDVTEDSEIPTFGPPLTVDEIAAFPFTSRAVLTLLKRNRQLQACVTSLEAQLQETRGVRVAAPGDPLYCHEGAVPSSDALSVDGEE